MQAIGAALRQPPRSTSGLRVGWDRDSDKRTTASRSRTRGIRGGGSSRRPVALRLGIREGAADRLGDSFKALAIAAIRDHLDKVENRDPELVEPFNYGEEPEEPGV